MVQHLEFLDEAACGLQWAVPCVGLVVGRLISVWQREAFVLWRGDRGGRVGKEMGKNVIWSTCMVRNHTSEWRGWACCEFWPFVNWLGARAHAGCWKQGRGRGFSFALRTILSSTMCSLYLLTVVQRGPELANWSLLTTCLPLKLTITGLLGGLCRSSQLPPTQTTGWTVPRSRLSLGCSFQVLKSCRLLPRAAFVWDCPAWGLKGIFKLFPDVQLNLHSLSLNAIATGFGDKCDCVCLISH